MRYDFTEQDITDESNKIELEGEDVTLIGKYIEDVENEENTYVITGDAIVEGELYHEFSTMFKIEKLIEDPNARKIVEQEWDWFDYICD